MRRLTLSFLLLIIASAAFGQNSKYGLEDLYGAWGDTVQVDAGNGFVFLPDSSWMIIMDGHFVGGEEWKDGDNEITNIYYVDFQAAPMTLDLLMIDKLTSGQKKLLAIFEFLDKDLIKMAVGFDGTRPNDFPSKAKDLVILRKAKNN